MGCSLPSPPPPPWRWGEGSGGISGGGRPVTDWMGGTGGLPGLGRTKGGHEAAARSGRSACRVAAKRKKTIETSPAAARSLAGRPDTMAQPPWVEEGGGSEGGWRMADLTTALARYWRSAFPRPPRVGTGRYGGRDDILRRDCGERDRERVLTGGVEEEDGEAWRHVQGSYRFLVEVEWSACRSWLSPVYTVLEPGQTDERWAQKTHACCLPLPISRRTPRKRRGPTPFAESEKRYRFIPWQHGHMKSKGRIPAKLIHEETVRRGRGWVALQNADQKLSALQHGRVSSGQVLAGKRYSAGYGWACLGCLGGVT
ncbi:hypothetical protein VTK73DRAFT_4017 [Phialemonium thermophilum]|uniref:Uncharacterized protein n=1 Tax=Phialemonium thermophilum TaxID=223376 RepID=A0ABR3VDE0_9PEZI